jgi:hypothetical protein
MQNKGRNIYIILEVSLDCLVIFHIFYVFVCLAFFAGIFAPEQHVGLELLVGAVAALGPIRTELVFVLKSIILLKQLFEKSRSFCY